MEFNSGFKGLKEFNPVYYKCL